ncbi:hypothetical protein FACS1894113_3630 [Alphaproteobacteria bacterium]|nr:hypothetical protein FACS1894113_3630 [Alphaproteobacteria bacterium]
MNKIIEKSQFSALDIATETFEKKTEKSILKKKYRYVYNDYSSKICLPMQPVVEICSVKNNRNTKAEPTVEIEYIAGICDDPEKVPKDIHLALLQILKNIYDSNDIAISSYKPLSIS